MDDDYLLSNDYSKELYHNHASKHPIIDYHCHLDPKLIAEDHKFKSITELWLGGDHYKWRAMRSNGVDEKYITGDASDWEKFLKWAETVPYTMRNPLYQWTHLELKTAFGINKILNPETAKEIYEECNEKLKNMSAKTLMLHYNVETVCTTDDPIDSLEHHIKIKESGFNVNVLPTWRPDKAMMIETGKDYIKYITKLSEITNIHINSFDKLIEAIKIRHDFFHSVGCRLSDHGVEELYDIDYTQDEINNIFIMVLNNGTPNENEIKKFKTAMMHRFGEMDYEKNWSQQIHYGAIRNNNTRMFNSIGPDTGFDSIGEFNTAKGLAKFLDNLDKNNTLTKTIIYNLNPSANEMIATMIGNFQDGKIPGKIQFGSGWWFLDQKDGMQKQMNALSNLGLLSRFVGMLTDSRSFISYPRHECFRRILCELIGNDIMNGELPASEMKFISNMVDDICYNNAKEYFKF